MITNMIINYKFLLELAIYQLTLMRHGLKIVSIIIVYIFSAFLIHTIQQLTQQVCNFYIIYFIFKSLLVVYYFFFFCCFSYCFSFGYCLRSDKNTLQKHSCFN